MDEMCLREGTSDLRSAFLLGLLGAVTEAAFRAATFLFPEDRGDLPHILCFTASMAVVLAFMVFAARRTTYVGMTIFALLLTVGWRIGSIINDLYYAPDLLSEFGWLIPQRVAGLFEVFAIFLLVSGATRFGVGLHKNGVRE